MVRPLPCSSSEPMDLNLALDASGVVGTWAHEIWAGRITLSGPLARLVGISPEAGEQGVPVASFLAGLHDDDRARIDSTLHAAGEGGGPVTIAFRTRETGPSGARRLVLRGRIVCDDAGRPVRGCGIAIDLTEDHGGSGKAQGRVNRMAEHAIALRDLASDLPRPALARLVDGLMMEIGYELARHLHEGDAGRRH